MGSLLQEAAVTSEESTRFKAEIAPHLETAIEANGGVERVRKIYGMMNSVIDFLAGWTSGAVLGARHALDRANVKQLTHEETRRIYDLVRLRLESASTTS